MNTSEQFNNQAEKGPRLILHIERGKVWKFEELPSKSIALDGAVEGPEVDAGNQRFSFDHHDKCVRLVTSATCEQVKDALLLGLETDSCNVYINDIDGDTVMAYVLLKHPELARDPVVQELVEVVGKVDAHGPAYPTRNPKLADAFYLGPLKRVSDLHRSKKYSETDLTQLLEECSAGTLELIEKMRRGEGLATREEKERTFEITYTGTGWIMAKSDDFVFDLLYAAGHTRAIAYQELSDGSFRYTVGKKSEIVGDFPVGPASKEGTILHALNDREPGWGGGSSIGGSPRNQDGSSSRLSPDEVAAIVAETIARDK